MKVISSASVLKVVNDGRNNSSKHFQISEPLL